MMTEVYKVRRKDARSSETVSKSEWVWGISPTSKKRQSLANVIACHNKNTFMIGGREYGKR